jgi:hypothetical protein
LAFAFVPKDANTFFVETCTLLKDGKARGSFNRNCVPARQIAKTHRPGSAEVNL